MTNELITVRHDLMSATTKQSGEALTLISILFPGFPVGIFRLNNEGIHYAETPITSFEGAEQTKVADTVFFLRKLCFQFGPRSGDSQVFFEDNSTFLNQCYAGIMDARISANHPLH